MRESGLGGINSKTSTQPERLGSKATRGKCRALAERLWRVSDQMAEREAADGMSNVLIMGRFFWVTPLNIQRNIQNGFIRPTIRSPITGRTFHSRTVRARYPISRHRARHARPRQRRRRACPLLGALRLPVKYRSSPRSRSHRRPLCQDTSPCSRSWSDRAGAGQPGDCRFAGRSALPSCVAKSVYRISLGRGRC